jgi:hypothetical protein
MGKIKLRFMQQTKQTQPTRFRQLLEQTSIGGNTLPPTWGKVKSSYPDHTVDVELQNGLVLSRIGAKAGDWVSDEGDFSIGEKNVPPIGSKVLLVFPDGRVENAFVIAGAFDQLSDKQTEELLLDGEEKLRVLLTEANWKRTYDKETGKFTIIDNEDGSTFSIEIDKENEKITINDWHDNHIVIDTNGITVTDTNNNSFTFDSNGCIVQDLSGNKITFGSSGLNLVDANGNEVDMGVTGVTINSNLEVLP